MPADAVQEHGGRPREGGRLARGPGGVAVRRRRRHGGHGPLLDGVLLVPRRPGLLGRRDKPHAGQGGAQAQGARQGQERPRRRRAHSRGAAHRPVRRDQARHRRGGVAEVAVALPAVAARHGRRAQDPVHMPDGRPFPGIRGRILRHVRGGQPRRALQVAASLRAGAPARSRATSPRRPGAPAGRPGARRRSRPRPSPRSA